jgi:pimeloyl-ACP methyl ester carboxylesterase
LTLDTYDRTVLLSHSRAHSNTAQWNTAHSNTAQSNRGHSKTAKSKTAKSNTSEVEHSEVEHQGGSMTEIQLSAGTIDYQDTGGNGPTVVLLHGLLMDATLWEGVIADLEVDHRCLAPTLPLGAHRSPMNAGADLTMEGVASLVTEFLERLDLSDVTLVGNDTGGVLVQLLAARHASESSDPGIERIGRIVLVSCDAFDNYPPGLTGKAVVMAGKLPPGLFGAFMQQMRVRPIRRLPVTYGWLTKRGDAACIRCLKPIFRTAGVRRDTVRALRDMGANRRLLVDLSDQLAKYDEPALIVWAKEDRVMPPEHGRRLVELLPDARLVEIDDSYTFVPLDQPTRLAGAIRDFVNQPAA